MINANIEVEDWSFDFSAAMSGVSVLRRNSKYRFTAYTYNTRFAIVICIVTQANFMGLRRRTSQVWRRFR
jgi:hypothetical protein